MFVYKAYIHVYICTYNYMFLSVRDLLVSGQPILATALVPRAHMHAHAHTREG